MRKKRVGTMIYDSSVERIESYCRGLNYLFYYKRGENGNRHQGKFRQPLQLYLFSMLRCSQ